MINAFVDGGKGGNPAGVVLNADGLTASQKQEVAAKVGLSETAFVSSSSVADYKLEFFTPSRQIPHCGHATIATFSYLSQQGLIREKSSKETIDGIREILLDGELAFMEQRAPVYRSVEEKKAVILQSLGLQGSDLEEGAEMQVVDTGNSFLVVPVKSEGTLANLDLDMKAISWISDYYGLVGFYVFCIPSQPEERDATARMFAPAYGIPEESATGMAAGPLACYLHNRMRSRKNRFLIQQGSFMKHPSPSLLTVNLQVENDRIIGLMVGGKGIATGSKTVSLQ